MSDTEAAALIDTSATVEVPEGEVSREDLVKILEDSRASEAAAEAEPEKPAVPVKDPEVEKVSARIIANRKAEMRAAEERKAIASERAEVERRRAEVERRRAELDEHTKRADAFQAAKLSPSKALELLGMTPKQFLETLATEDDPAAVAARAMQGTQSEVQKLQARIDAMEAAEVARKRQAEQHTIDSDYNAATQAFLDHVDGAPAKYPHLLAEHTPSEIASMARRTAEEHSEAYFKKFNVYPDDDVIAEHLESQAKARAEALAERRARVGSPAPIPSQGTPAIQGQPVTAAKPRTLTNGVTSTKATANKPWSQADADAESIRIIEQLHSTRPAP